MHRLAEKETTMDKVRRFMRENRRRCLLNLVIVAGIAWSLTEP